MKKTLCLILSGFLCTSLHAGWNLSPDNPRQNKTDNSASPSPDNQATKTDATTEDNTVYRFSGGSTTPPSK